LNYMNLVKHTLRQQQQQQAQQGNNIVVSSTDALGKDYVVVEPPKFITARNVSAIFDKLGYDSSLSPHLFHVLCERLSKIRKTEFLALSASSSSPVPSNVSLSPNPGAGAGGGNQPNGDGFRTLTQSTANSSLGEREGKLSNSLSMTMTDYDSSLGGASTSVSQQISVSMGKAGGETEIGMGRETERTERETDATMSSMAEKRVRTASKAMDDLKEVLAIEGNGERDGEGEGEGEGEEEDDVFEDEEEYEDREGESNKKSGQERMDVSDFIRLVACLFCSYFML
jgi:hypothetical protein